MSGGRRPTWLLETCPRWCVRDHREDDHPEDRFHQGDAAVVPVLASSDVSGVEVGPTLRATEVAVRRARRPGGHEDWVAVEESEAADIRFALSTESVLRLAHALRLVVEADID